jgi:hypothetical protein
MFNSNITSFFRFVNKRASYPFGIISLAHAPVSVSSTILLQLPHCQAIYCMLLSIKSKYGTVTILTLLYMKLSNSNKLRSIITYLHLLHANQTRLNNLIRIRLTLRKATNQNIKTYTF